MLQQKSQTNIHKIRYCILKIIDQGREFPAVGQALDSCRAHLHGAVVCEVEHGEEDDCRAEMLRHRHGVAHDDPEVVLGEVFVCDEVLQEGAVGVVVGVWLPLPQHALPRRQQQLCQNLRRHRASRWASM